MIKEIKKILKATNVCQCVDDYTCEVCEAIEQALKQSQEKIDELEKEVKRLNDYAKRLIDESVKYNNCIDELEKFESIRNKVLIKQLKHKHKAE